MHAKQSMPKNGMHLFKYIFLNGHLARSVCLHGLYIVFIVWAHETLVLTAYAQMSNKIPMLKFLMKLTHNAPPII